jgi:hypothetical protein
VDSYEDTHEEFDADHTNPRAGYVQHDYTNSGTPEACTDPETDPYDERDTCFYTDSEALSLPNFFARLINNYHSTAYHTPEFHSLYCTICEPMECLK